MINHVIKEKVYLAKDMDKEFMYFKINLIIKVNGLIIK